MNIASVTEIDTGRNLKVIPRILTNLSAIFSKLTIFRNRNLLGTILP